MSSAFPLTRLPVDLQHHLLKFLPYPALRSLIATSRYWYNLCSDTELALLRSRYSAILFHWEQEKVNIEDPEAYLVYRSTDAKFIKIPCYTCLKWQSLNYFTLGMRVRSIGRPRRPGGPRANERICIPCGLRIRFYSIFQVKHFMGEPPDMCQECGIVVDESSTYCSPRWLNTDVPVGSSEHEIAYWCKGCVRAVGQDHNKLKHRDEEWRKADIARSAQEKQRKQDARERRYSFMREERIDWGLWKRTGRGCKRRSKATAVDSTACTGDFNPKRKHQMDVWAIRESVIRRMHELTTG